MSRNAQNRINFGSDAVPRRWNIKANLWCLVIVIAGLAARALCSTNEVPLRAAPPQQAQVFVVRDAEAMVAFAANQQRIEAMVARGITNLTVKPSISEAWRSLVSTQDIVGIKVFSEPGPNSGTRPAVVEAVVKQLIEAGQPANHIIIWDKRYVDLRLAGFVDLAKRLGVRAAGSAESGYDETKFYETPLIGNLVWGDLEFGKKDIVGPGRKSFVSKLLTEQITKIINITPLMNHNEAGVTGNLFSLAFGSVDNVQRFESDSSRLATAVPEIYALPSLSDRVVLNVTDALICQYEGEERSLLHYSVILNELRFSRDPVALDALSIDELQRQRESHKAPKVKANTDICANAALLELGIADLKKIQIVTVP